MKDYFDLPRSLLTQESQTLLLADSSTVAKVLYEPFGAMIDATILPKSSNNNDDDDAHAHTHSGFVVRVDDAPRPTRRDRAESTSFSATLYLTKGELGRVLAVAELGPPRNQRQ